MRFVKLLLLISLTLMPVLVQAEPAAELVSDQIELGSAEKEILSRFEVEMHGCHNVKKNEKFCVFTKAGINADKEDTNMIAITESPVKMMDITQAEEGFKFVHKDKEGKIFHTSNEGTFFSYYSDEVMMEGRAVYLSGLGWIGKNGKTYFLDVRSDTSELRNEARVILDEVEEKIKTGDLKLQ